MELIKQIKEAERQAKEIIEQARAEAGRVAEEVSVKESRERVRAEEERKKAIGRAVAEAEEAGKVEVEKLGAAGQQNRAQRSMRSRRLANKSLRR